MKRRANTRGFTLVEVALAMSVLAVTTVATASMLVGGFSAYRALQHNSVVLTRAQLFVETLRSLQVGLGTEPAANAAQLAEIFDGDHDVGLVSGEAPTLTSVAKGLEGLPGDQLVLSLGAGDSFPVVGEFLVRVSNNLSADLLRRASDPPGNPAAVSNWIAGSSLFLAEVRFRSSPTGGDGRLLLQTIRILDP